MERTTITVSDEVWRELNQKKDRGESFDDVLRNELGMNNDDEDKPRARDGQPLDELEFPTGRDRNECIAAINAAASYLEEEEEEGASMREIVAAVMPDHPIGYDVPELEDGERYRGAWWRRIVKPGLEASPDVEKPGPGKSEWRWRGE